MEIPPQPCGGEESPGCGAQFGPQWSSPLSCKSHFTLPEAGLNSRALSLPSFPVLGWGKSPLPACCAGQRHLPGLGRVPPGSAGSSPLSSSCSAPALKEPLGWQNQGGLAAAGRCSEPEEVETQLDLKNERFQHPSVPDSSANKQFFFPGCCVSFCLVAAGPCPVQGNGCAAAVWGGGRTQWSASESSGVANCSVSTA